MATITLVLNGDTGLVSRNKINANDAALNADIATNANNITTLQSNILTSDLVVGQSASFTKVLAALTKIESIDFKWAVSSPIVTIGTTLGGDELLPALSVPFGEILNNTFNKTFVGSETIYITITGGTVDVEFNYRTNRFIP